MGLFSNAFVQGQRTASSQPTCSSQITSRGHFHSWVHPQSSLPHAVISALTSAAGGILVKTRYPLSFLLTSFSPFNNCIISQGQLDFLSKRQQAWEDSFRSLYYMLRKNLCKIFYGNYIFPYDIFF